MVARLPKILYYCESGGYGGMEKVLFDTATGMAERGFQVVVLMNAPAAMPTWGAALAQGGVHYVPIDIRSTGVIANTRRTYQRFSAHRPDLIHFVLGSVTSCRSAIVAGYLLKRVTQGRVRLIGTEQLDSAVRVTTMSRREKMLKKVTLRLLDHTVCVSKAVYSHLITFFHGDPQRCSIIYNAIDCDDLTARTTVREIELPVSIANKVVVVVPARLEPVKGHLTLIEAIHAGRVLFEDTVFLLLGEGSERRAILNEVERLGLAQIVHVLGFQPNMSAYLQMADICVLPSFSEGLPLALLEAMAMGVPVVGTRVSGIEELVSDGVTGYLVPPGGGNDLVQAIGRLVQSKALRFKIGQNARRLVREQFHRKRMLDQLQTVYGMV